MSEEKLAQRVAIWRSKTPPSTPHEFDLGPVPLRKEISEAFGKDLYFKIRWDPVREQYEFELLELIATDTFTPATITFPDQSGYQWFTDWFKGWGITEFHGVKCANQPEPQLADQLPGFPQPTKIPL